MENIDKNNEINSIVEDKTIESRKELSINPDLIVVEPTSFKSSFDSFLFKAMSFIVSMLILFSLTFSICAIVL